jgi:hypothetical protein
VEVLWILQQPLLVINLTGVYTIWQTQLQDAEINRTLKHKNARKVVYQSLNELVAEVAWRRLYDSNEKYACQSDRA